MPPTPPEQAPRPSLDTNASTRSVYSDATGSIACRSQATVDLLDALGSVLPPEWTVKGEALALLGDYDTPLPRLLFDHPVLPDGFYIILGQDFAENVPCYSFCLVRRDVDDAAAWDDDEPYELSSNDFSELGIDEDEFDAALGVLEPWLEAADDYMFCSLPDLEFINGEDELPAGSMPMPESLLSESTETGKLWFNSRLPFGWFIYQRSDGVFLYASLDPKRKTSSCKEMRRLAYLDSVRDDALAEREGGWARLTAQEFLEDLDDIEGENSLTDTEEDKEAIEELVRGGLLPDGPRNPPPGSSPFDQTKLEEAAVLFHCLLPMGWLLVKHPRGNRFVYVHLCEQRATYLYESVTKHDERVDGYNESVIDACLPSFDNVNSSDDSGGSDIDDEDIVDCSDEDGGKSIRSEGLDVSNLNEMSQQDRRSTGARLGMKRRRRELEEVPPAKKKRIYTYQERIDILERWDGGYRPRELKSSVSRWRRRLCRYLPSGNKSKPGLSGTYQFLLVLFKLAYPGATLEECIVFIAESAPTPKIFTPSQVTEALKRLGMTRKRSSTDATQAFSEVNLMKRHIFWNTSWPTGVKGTDRWRLIDADECGIELRDTNRNYGHAVANLRVRQPGNYTKSTKFTVLLGIEAGDPSLPDGVEGSVTNPRRYIEINQKPGTTSNDYCDFVTGKILKSFKEGEPQRTLMHDNLSSHLDPALYDAITEAGHRALCRPPYVPSDGPVEWAFNQLGCELRNRSGQIKDESDLLHHIRDILLNLKGMDKLFEKCGY